MTKYATETEAESYEAADLARIALQAAIDAIDAYQARNGVCDAPFRCTLHVDNGNEADREGTFDLPEIDEPVIIFARAEDASGNKTEWSGGWIRHDGVECPVHQMDMVEVKSHNGEGDISVADHEFWPAAGSAGIEYYRPLRDEDGVPYCSAEGLEEWAEYVATDASGEVGQCKNKPYIGRICWRARGPHLMAPSYFSNTRDHWTQTLRRVYRREGA